MELSFRDLIGDPCRGRERERERGGGGGGGGSVCVNHNVTVKWCVGGIDKIFMILLYNSQLSFLINILELAIITSGFDSQLFMKRG